MLSGPGEGQAFAQEAEKQGCRVGVEITENFAACFLGEGCWSKKKKKKQTTLTYTGGTKDVVFQFASSVPLGDFYFFDPRNLPSPFLKE